LKVERLTAPIPNGFPVGDLWVREAEVRSLNGFDEQLLAACRDSSVSFKISMLLERVVTFGKLTLKLDIRESVRKMTVGDRIALLLHLRKAAFGDKMPSVLTCPACESPMSLDLSVTSLLQPVTTNPQKSYRLKVGKFSLRIRPLTGADMEALSSAEGAENPIDDLLRLCIVSSKPELPQKLSPAFSSAVGSKLEQIDPQADTVLNLSCPTCGTTFQAPLNIEKYFLEEVAARQGQLDREVHWLALNYHWSEKDILALPVAKRKRYIDLINESLAGEGE
jgi:hypothetical protein